MDLFLKVNQDFLSQCTKPKILVLNTGGTFASHFANPALDEGVHFIKDSCFEVLKQHFEFQCNDEGGKCLENSAMRFWIYELDPMLESEDMEMKDWCQLCTLIENAYRLFDGFVILHGTNTMDFTGSALSFMIKVYKLQLFTKIDDFTNELLSLSEPNKTNHFDWFNYPFIH